jgi:Thaumarchaeal output domain 1
MQLLYFDKDQAAARALHGEFLSYRGMRWELVHCKEHAEVEHWVQEGQFQVLLYRSGESESQILYELAALRNIIDAPPVVSVLETADIPFHLQLLEQGVHDSLDRSVSNGSTIMRRVRMAEARLAAWKRRSSVLDCESLLSVAEGAGVLESSTEAISKRAVRNDSSISLMPSQLRIAHLAPPEFPKLLTDTRALDKESTLITRFEGISQCVEALVNDVRQFHAIIVENSIFESEKQTALAEFDPFLGLIPCCVLTNEPSDFAALSYIEKGFAECLPYDQLNSELVAKALRKLVVRHRRQLANAIEQIQIGKNVSDRRRTVRPGSNRRQHARFPLKRKTIAIPMLPNLAPDLDNIRDSESVDISLGGMGIAVYDADGIPTRNWVIAVEREGGNGFDYVSSYVRRVVYDSGVLRLGVVFQEGEDDFLHPRNLSPFIDPITKQFTHNTSSDILDRWGEIGFLKKVLNRRVKTCPECAAVCVAGSGCNQCGSHNYQHQELIHHFACAHVAASAEFISDGSVNCPKCLRRDLVVGADFEIIKSQYVCLDCSHTGSQLAEVGDCLNCRLRFPIAAAPEKEIYAYHVDKLDTLALVDAAR